MKKVAILQYRLLHYRVELFEILRSRLLSDGIQLDLIHGFATKTESSKKDEGFLDWSIAKNNPYIRVFGKDMVWQRSPKLRNYDLVITMQENRILSNYFNIIFSKVFGRPKIAYWGHGTNMQSTSPNGFRERWKRFWLDSVDYWFAYTKSTTKYLLDCGVDSTKIQTLDNAINTRSFTHAVQTVTDDEVNEVFDEFKISHDADICLFCGSIYTEKKIELLLEASEIISKKNPKYLLVVIGDGPQRHVIDEYLKKYTWIRYLGIQKGLVKSVLFSRANLLLNPGLVGLHILDSFSSRTPIVTLANSLHSPEFDYLVNGVNGLVVDGGVKSFADSIVKLLNDKEALSKMREECLKSSKYYTLENMVNNFQEGIKAALNLPKVD